MLIDDHARIWWNSDAEPALFESFPEMASSSTKKTSQLSIANKLWHFEHKLDLDKSKHCNLIFGKISFSGPILAPKITQEVSVSICPYISPLENNSL